MGLFKTIGGIIGAGKQKKATKKAVKALEAAGNQAIGTITAAQDAVLPTFRPYQDAGTKALGSLNDLLYGGAGAVAASPDYQFRVDEGQRALNSALNSRGLSESGAAMKEAVRFGQELGAGEYDARYRRLADLTRTGYGATSDAANIRLGTAGTVGGIQMDIGNARANGFIRRGDLTAAQWVGAGSLADKAANAALGAAGMPGGLSLSNLLKSSGIGGAQAGSGGGSSYGARAPSVPGFGGGSYQYGGRYGPLGLGGI